MAKTAYHEKLAQQYSKFKKFFGVSLKLRFQSQLYIFGTKLSVICINILHLKRK